MRLLPNKWRVKVLAGNSGEDAEDFARILREMYAAWDGPLHLEPGFHRLVRYSPFDEKGRRHTSFAEVRVRFRRRWRIGWGYPMNMTTRSYILDPYTKAKDHRTGQETEDVLRVLGGDLSDFYADPPGLADAIRKGQELAGDHGWGS